MDNQLQYNEQNMCSTIAWVGWLTDSMLLQQNVIGGGDLLVLFSVIPSQRLHKVPQRLPLADYWPDESGKRRPESSLQ